MTDLPAFHGWTHRPKELGGTDPVEIIVPDKEAVFSYGIVTTTISTANTWTPLNLSGWHHNKDLLSGSVAAFLDGSSSSGATGTDITFNETSTTHHVMWAVVARVIWDLDEVRNNGTFQDYDLGLRVIKTGAPSGYLHGTTMRVKAASATGSYNNGYTTIQHVAEILLPSECFDCRDVDTDELQVQAYHTIPYNVANDAPAVGAGIVTAHRLIRTTTTI